MKPLISVIIPVYNVEKYLRKCLDSICGQTYRNLEILCVNDGSTDGSAAILEEYAAKDARIKVITQKNSGVSAARNAALRIARGEWITGVDSDDYLAPDTYEYALDAYDDETDIICYGVHIVWEGMETDEKFERYFAVQHKGIVTPSSYHIKTTDSCFWNKLWRKSLIERFNQQFPEGMRYEDTYFYYTLAAHARHISYRPDKKYHYVRWGGSFMSIAPSETAKAASQHMQIAAAIFDFFRKHPAPRNTQHTVFVSFVDCVHASLAILPKQEIPSYLKKVRQMAIEYDLFEKYSQHLRFLRPVPWWLKPFVKRKTSKSYYGLPGFYLLTITNRQDKEIYRFLGLTIKRRALAPSLDEPSN